MMNRNKQGSILLTSVGGDIGQSVIQCLLDTEYADRLYGCDVDPYAAGRAILKRFEIAPAVSDKRAYKDFMTEQIRHSNLSYILPLNEKEICYFSNEKDYYNSLGVNILVLNKDIINTFFDKYKTIKFFEANNIKAPKTYLAEEYNGQIGFPLIFKPKVSCGGEGMVQINDQKELDFYLQRNPGSIVQELIGNVHEEYTVGVFSDGGHVYSMAFQRYLGYGSMTKIARLTDNQEFHLLAKKIAESCKLVGPLNIQMRRTRKGLLPFEINPRISSTVYFRHHFGFEDVRWWLDIFHDKEIDYIPEYEEGVAVRMMGSAFFDVKKNEIV